MFSLTKSHNWLIFKIINPAIEQRLEKYACGKLLDIGCGQKPYFQMAFPFVDKHIGIDCQGALNDRDGADILGVATNIPCKTGYFDVVLCTDVLEHLEEPKIAIMETCRVLKVGGYAIYTVPLFWHIHEPPRDFYRYTKYGLKYLFEECGFEIEEIKPLSGFIVMVSQFLAYYLLKFRMGGKLNPLWWLIPPINHLIQAIAYALNKIDRSEEFTIEYILVARKLADE